MKKAVYIGTVIFLFTTFPVLSQNPRDFDTTDLIGFWQTDSAAQLGAKINRQGTSDSPIDNAVSGDMDRAIISRKYGFLDNGFFTAQWLLGTEPAVVNGTWGMVSIDKIFIEVNRIETMYSVNSHGKDGIVLVPMRERRGYIHELYFIKYEEK